MKFSVLMSVYVKENPLSLERSLNSIYNQTLPPNEVILVEDGPLTTELDAVINDFKTKCPSLKLVKLAQNQGLGKALNEGLNHCSFDYVARMDSDDICFPERFEKQMSYLESHPDIDVIGCWTQEFCMDEKGEMQLMSLKRFPHNVWDNFKYCTKRCPIEHPAVIFKKGSVVEVGGYQHCYLFEDYHLWARMFVNGSKFYNIQEPLLYFRMSDDSFKRRGGMKYAKSEYNALKEFKRMGFLSRNEFLFAVVTRFPIRILPNFLRKFVYTKFLR